MPLIGICTGLRLLENDIGVARRLRAEPYLREQSVKRARKSDPGRALRMGSLLEGPFCSLAIFFALAQRF